MNRTLFKLVEVLSIRGVKISLGQGVGIAD